MTFGCSLGLREDGLTIQLWVEHLAAQFMAPYRPVITYAKHSIYLSSGIFAKKTVSRLSHSLGLAYYNKRFHV